MKVLLHACCGPCLLEPFDALVAEHDVTVLYANPNIHPAEEYRRRRDTLLAYATGHDIEVIEERYDPTVWAAAVADVEDDPAERCRACFGLRLGIAARTAASLGMDAIATTLTVSPYQNQVAVAEAGHAAAAQAGITYIDADFRERYPEATRRSRELGMYRQNYCGCALSDLEAQAERAARREEREAKRAQRGAR
ncbi:MAG: epoxyqueuosine reductase QueH [Actinobacteria bacterium]|nr:MAG: epoxyqueuosine reductase QueH [Actinomycetota bacterium]